MFSGVTVAIAVARLLFIDMTIIQSVGAGAVSVVMIAVVVATTFVPALLVLSTKHVAGAGMLADAGVPAVRRGVRPHAVRRRLVRALGHEGPAARVVGVPQCRDVAGPAVDPRLADGPGELRGRAAAPGQPDARGYEQIQADSGTGRPDDHRGGGGCRCRGADRVVRLGCHPAGVERVGEVETTGEIAQLPVFTADDAATDVVNEIRDVRPPNPRRGSPGRQRSSSTSRAAAPRRPDRAAVRRDGDLVLLFLMTGSVVLPIKAVIMNVLSLGPRSASSS